MKGSDSLGWLPDVSSPGLNEGPPGEGQRRLDLRQPHVGRAASTKGRPVKGSDEDVRAAHRALRHGLNEGPPGEGQRHIDAVAAAHPAYGP